eukprot:1393156-Amorphochlora_amoeboformis.AAC.1
MKSEYLIKFKFKAAICDRPSAFGRLQGELVTLPFENDNPASSNASIYSFPFFFKLLEIVLKSTNAIKYIFHPSGA